MKIRVDSVMRLNINEGDYLIIKKQNTADNTDIVAVDGNATLK